MSMSYPIATYGTIAALLVAILGHYVARAWVRSLKLSNFERYRRRQFATTILFALCAIVIAVLWGRLLEHKGTFFGLLGAGLAVALREPLLAIAGRIAIFAGHMYRVGDRIELNQMAGDVIDVGFFYTRLLEIGNWVKGDQATGRITQFSNSIIFGTPVFNYTQNFSYIWDEIIVPVTYDSNVDQAQKILLEAAAQYSKEFLDIAEEELEKLRHSFLVPAVELKPAVFTDVTDNYVQITLRYVVDPKKRRVAKSFLFTRTLEMLRNHKDIAIGSTTADFTLHQAPADQQGTKQGNMDQPPTPKEIGKQPDPKAA